MSKIGNQPINISATVQVDINDQEVVVKGKEGQVKINLSPLINIERDNDKIYIKPKKNLKKAISQQGLFRQLIANAIVGVEKPWSKRLEVVGTGYNCRLQGEDLVFKLGYSHLITFKKVEGVKFQVEKNNQVVVIGPDKQLVGEVAYKIRQLKKPDAYKGKGIRYFGERISLKPTKKVKAAGAA